MEALRQIPPVNDVLRAEELAAFRHIVNQPFVAEILDSVLTETRRELAQTKSPASRAELTSVIAGKVASYPRIAGTFSTACHQRIRSCSAYQPWSRSPA